MPSVPWLLLLPLKMSLLLTKQQPPTLSQRDFQLGWNLRGQAAGKAAKIVYPRHVGCPRHWLQHKHIMDYQHGLPCQLSPTARPGVHVTNHCIGSAKNPNLVTCQPFTLHLSLTQWSHTTRAKLEQLCIMHKNQLTGAPKLTVCSAQSRSSHNNEAHCVKCSCTIVCCLLQSLQCSLPICMHILSVYASPLYRSTLHAHPERICATSVSQY